MKTQPTWADHIHAAFLFVTVLPFLAISDLIRRRVLWPRHSGGLNCGAAEMLAALFVVICIEVGLLIGLLVAPPFGVAFSVVTYVGTGLTVSLSGY